VNGIAHSSSAFRLLEFSVEWLLVEDCVVVKECDDGSGDDSVMWLRLLVIETGSCGDRNPRYARKLEYSSWSGGNFAQTSAMTVASTAGSSC
jgi:hypothetical protein